MNALTIILKLIPAIIAVVKAIEESIPGEGQGEKKLAAVRQILEIADANIAELWPKIASIVGVLVGLLNSTGVFKK